MQVYLVGGAVRDSLLNIPIMERDWVVVGATPEYLLSQGYQQVGNHFPVFLHPNTHEEYALARTECKTGHGYQGFSFQFTPNVTLEEDLLRRDLTINAMAMDEQGQITDPYHGLADLKLKILRHVSDAFIEDPLRVLRVARFYARFYHLDFEVAPETLELMQKIVKSNELSFLSAERIWMEWTKALQTQNPEQFIQCLKDCGALQVIAPELIDVNLKTFAKFALNSVEINERFILLTQSLSEDSLKSLAKRLKIPKHLMDLSLKFIGLSKNISGLLLKPAEDILEVLQRFDSFRQTQLIHECLNAFMITQQITSNEKDMILNILEACKAIRLSADLQGSSEVKAIQGFFREERLAVIHQLQISM